MICLPPKNLPGAIRSHRLQAAAGAPAGSDHGLIFAPMRAARANRCDGRDASGRTDQIFGSIWRKMSLIRPSP